MTTNGEITIGDGNPARITDEVEGEEGQCSHHPKTNSRVHAGRRRPSPTPPSDISPACHGRKEGKREEVKGYNGRDMYI